MVAGQEQTAKLPEQIAWKADGKTGPAVQVGEGTSIDLGELGDFEKEQAFTAMAWFFRTEEESKAPGSIVARMDKAEDLRGWDLFTEKNEIAVHLVSKWPGNALRVVTTDGAAKPGQWQHVAVTYNGSGKAGGVQIHVNGVPRKLKVETDKLSASIRTKVPFMVGRRGGGGEVFTGAVQDVRLYSSVLSAKHLLALAELPDLRTILKKPAAERTPEEKQRLLALHSTDDPQLAEWIRSKDRYCTSRWKSRTHSRWPGCSCVDSTISRRMS